MICKCENALDVILKKVSLMILFARGILLFLDEGGPQFVTFPL